jgi:pyruvate kinase
MADLPGPKMRIGQLAQEPVQIVPGRTFTLTTRDVVGDTERASMSFSRLPQVVKPGNILFLNDGIIQLEVEQVDGPDVRCRVLAGGELRSRKGLNLPGIELGISAFTSRDRECLEFALAHGVDAVSQSFVESAADIQAVREAARSFGGDPFILAKIERSRALEHVDEILAAADGIMVARGDLGVEVPIERIAILQKTLVQNAVRLGKPVIIATQMLESMTHSRQPTRAEATDVANAVLDGADCVMLSGESATGDYPVEAVATLARIAAATEPHRARFDLWERLKSLPKEADYSTADLLSLSVEAVIAASSPAAVLVPTHSGATARAIARFRLPVWVAAPTDCGNVVRHLQFSYGIAPAFVSQSPTDWTAFARDWVRTEALSGPIALLIQGPSPGNPRANHRLEILQLH